MTRADEMQPMSPDMDLRISPRTVQQETVDKLRLAILSGMFQPGNRLVESQLCIQLGISRPSLREALRSLAAERLIEIVPNRGPSINHVRAFLSDRVAWAGAIAVGGLVGGAEGRRWRGCRCGVRGGPR